MILKNLTLVNFKNYQHIELSFEPGVNCLVGNNGVGKTNVLDGIHYLSMCKSYLNSVDKQNIRFGEKFFIIQGEWLVEDESVEIYCGVKAGEKKVVKKNKVNYEKLGDHIGEFPSVVISPYDRDLIVEGSEVRRKWIDGIISQFNREYLYLLVKYTKILEQRNALLKQFFEHGFFERESIEIWDEQLIQVGAEIYKQRIDFLKDFIPTFQTYYEFIGSPNETVGLEYKSQLNDCTFTELLALNQRKDAVATYTTGGVHRDDFLFTINGHPVKKFGSQGQQKSYLIALKLAQFEWLKKHLHKKPIVLLDDIFDKLDNERVAKLMKLVSENVFGQVIVTDTDSTRVQSIFEKINVPYKAIPMMYQADLQTNG
jgi:DNA replication and repair protein RecF